YYVYDCFFIFFFFSSRRRHTRWPRDWSSDVCSSDLLEARIGLSTGEVHVLSSPGQDLHVSGAAASVASQLEACAPVGGVLLSDETYELVRDAVRAEPIDGAWRLDEVLADSPAYARRLDAPLVGRERELERLRGVYAN